jgi:hypothetical protein
MLTVRRAPGPKGLCPLKLTLSIRIDGGDAGAPAMGDPGVSSKSKAARSRTNGARFILPAFRTPYWFVLCIRPSRYLFNR